MGVRYEKDSLGTVAVNETRYWGAQTQRAVDNFVIGEEKFPRRMIHAMALVKYAAAAANKECGVLAPELADAIQQASTHVMRGALDGHFPLVIWQSGSGTQFNMNANEVIANRATELLGGIRGDTTVIHPNDHVNRGMSTNDAFPSAMRIAVVREITDTLLPALDRLAGTLQRKEKEYAHIVKCGRTHLQDAVPLSLGQEFSGYRAQIETARQQIDTCVTELCALPLGGTAVGTGLNAAEGFADAAVEHIRHKTDIPFRRIENTFSAMAAHDEMVRCSGVLSSCACAIKKTATDIAWLSSGPRAGLDELTIPHNEPGSSIMPGKVNPTQCEAACMACTQVIGNATTVSIAAMSGNFELNVYKPLIAYAVLQSVRLLGDVSVSLADKCIEGITPNRDRIDSYVRNSLMLVTALTGEIGYDRAAEIAHHAYEKNMTLKEAAVALGHITAERFDALADPKKMI
jgi:fumarate hydratase class II